jgi:hypothetical protein
MTALVSSHDESGTGVTHYGLLPKSLFACSETLKGMPIWATARLNSESAYFKKQ